MAKLEWSGSIIGWESVKGRDTLTDQRAAKALARNIERYYRQRGFAHVVARAVWVAGPAAHWTIKSNIRFRPCDV